MTQTFEGFEPTCRVLRQLYNIKYILDKCLSRKHVRYMNGINKEIIAMTIKWLKRISIDLHYIYIYIHILCVQLT